jgi:two-component system sensor histidine kinase RpfC
MSKVANLLTRLQDRPDSEHVQAFLRIMMGLFHAGYVVVVYTYAFPRNALSLPALLLISLLVVIGGIASLAHIVAFPGTNQFRRWVGVIQDTTWIGLTIFALGDSGTPCLGMYLWVVIGNGFRYGSQYLYGSAGLALVSFYIAAYFNPYYGSDYGLLGLTTFLLGVVIPVYLGSLLKKLHQALQAARVADQTKTRFLANVSHDLRTPLNAILANCELLARGLPANSGLQLRDMQEAATTLNRLVSDLLDVAKIEGGRISIRSAPFNLAQLLGRVVRLNEPAARANGTQIYLTISADTPARVLGDDLRLEQVLNNILSNAVKYTENGAIHIHAKPDTTGCGNAFTGVILSISDTGIGIDPKAISRIFSRFEQADTCYSRSYSGAGLGLSIAKELVALMGGSIAVESARDKGSQFNISIPLPPCSHLANQATTDYKAAQLIVVCHEEAGQQRWANTFDGRSLPLASVFTEQNIRDRKPALPDESSEPTVVVVDAEKLRIAPASIPMLMGRSSCSSSTNFILLNAPRYCPDHNAVREYRCVAAGATVEDVRRCLDIVLWSTSCYRSETEQARNLRTYKHSLKNRTVLIADDNELNRRVISNILNSIHARVVEACDGQSALDRLINQHIDIAVLDIQMPKLTGIEVIRAVSRRDRWNATPLIALTADTTDECRSKCLEAGAIAVLHKPVSMYPLYRELCRAITCANSAQKELPSCEPQSTGGGGEIDYALLHELAQSAQRPDYLASLVTCFKSEGEKLLQDLRTALHTADFENGRALLHRLKGMSSAIGANPIAALCHDKLMSPDTELRITASGLMEQLFRLHHWTADALEAYLSSKSPTIPRSDASNTPLRNDVFSRSSRRSQYSSSL